MVPVVGVAEDYGLHPVAPGMEARRGQRISTGTQPSSMIGREAVPAPVREDGLAA
jgi:hypothetical protein